MGQTVTHSPQKTQLDSLREVLSNVVIKESEPRAAIAEGEGQLPVEWIGMRGHEKSACAAAVANRSQRKLPLVFTAIPFKFTLPFGFVHDRP